MKLPWKKQEESEEEIESSERETIQNEINNSSVNIPKGENRLDQLEVEIERIKALLESQREYKKFVEEKFSRNSESIGELRSSMIEREKQIKDLEIAALKAADIVKEVEPEKLMVQVRRAEAKSDAVEGKLESYDNLFKNLIEEIKSVRRAISVLGGMENLKEFGDESRRTLADVKKLESQVLIDSNKIERIFQDMQKKYDEYQNMKESINDHTLSLEEDKKQLNNIKVELAQLMSKDEMMKIKSEISELLREAGLKSLTKENKLLEKGKEVLEKVTSKHESSIGIVDLSGVENKIRALNELVIDTRKKIDSEESRITNILEETKDKINAEETRTSRIINEVESYMRKVGNHLYEETKNNNEKSQEELLKVKAYVKQIEKNIEDIKHDTSNPVYQALKKEIFEKLSYYDNFLSDTIAKIPYLEKEVYTLKTYSKQVISKNQEIINYIKTNKVLNSESDLAKKRDIHIVEHQVSLTQDKINELREEISKEITALSSKIVHTSEELENKESKKGVDKLKEQISKEISTLSSRLVNTIVELENKENKVAVGELRELLVNQLKKDKRNIENIQETVNNMLSLLNNNELYQLKDEVSKIKLSLNKIIEREKEILEYISNIVK